MTAAKRIICMVPSLTELLIDAGVNVVGRTRFCIHPRDQVSRIPIVGGTKDIQWEKVKELQPDLLIFDQEENPRIFAENSPLPYYATHVTSVLEMEKTCQDLSKILCNERLKEIAERWRLVCLASYNWDFANVPGAIATIRPLNSSDLTESYANRKVIYVIWRNPWMAAGRSTFIGSVLELMGAVGLNLFEHEKYPRFELPEIDYEKSFFLFSTEPYPFAQKLKELEELGLTGALVDGECYSWFGIRTLQFLEKYKKAEPR